jgi:alkylhydroperoxidase family enzyme
LGREFGITEEQLRHLSTYRESDAFTQLEKLVLDLAVDMTQTPAEVSDELFSELRKRLSSPQFVELATAIAQANFRGRFNKAFNVQPAGFSEGAYCPLPEG